MHNREMIRRTRPPGHYDRKHDKSCPSVNRSIDEPTDQPIHLSRTNVHIRTHVRVHTRAHIIRRWKWFRIGRSHRRCSS